MRKIRFTEHQIIEVLKSVEVEFTIIIGNQNMVE